MKTKEHDYVMYLMNSVWTEIDYDEDTFLLDTIIIGGYKWTYFLK